MRFLNSMLMYISNGPFRRYGGHFESSVSDLFCCGIFDEQKKEASLPWLLRSPQS